MNADYADLVALGTTWVAESDQQVLGFIVLVEGEDHLLLDNVAVDPRVQGLGIGSELLRLAEDEARHRGHREIRLYTNEAMTENLDYYPARATSRLTAAPKTATGGSTSPNPSIPPDRPNGAKRPISRWRAVRKLG